MESVILCVDDEQMVLTSLKAQLRHSLGDDVEIETAESGEEALEIIEELQEEGLGVAVVISDQIMPGMKGDELLIELHRQQPDTVKIMLTGQAEADAVGNAINKANLYRYIAKPWEESDLALTVSEAIRSFQQERQLAEKNRELEELNANLEKLVEERTEELKKKNAAIEESIIYAKRIQEAMLPRKAEYGRVFDDYFVWYMPRDIVSGDYYWFATVNEDAQPSYLSAVVDCTGHGVPGAFMSVIANALLDQALAQQIYIPSKILDYLNEGIIKALRQENIDKGEERRRDGMDVAIISYKPDKKQLQYAGAHLPLIHIHDGRIERIKADPMSVGGEQRIRKSEHYTNHELTLSGMSHFYMFSDGYADQFGGPHNRKYMTKRFREFLFSIHDKPFEAQAEALREEFNRWRGNNRQVDDILVMGLEIKA